MILNSQTQNKIDFIETAIKDDDIIMDQYDLQLADKTLLLKSCQEEKTFTSCMSCDDFFTCELRKAYVIAVYASMSKGKHGSFEF